MFQTDVDLMNKLRRASRCEQVKGQKDQMISAVETKANVEGAERPDPFVLGQLSLRDVLWDSADTSYTTSNYSITCDHL